MAKNLKGMISNKLRRSLTKLKLSGPSNSTEPFSHIQVPQDFHEVGRLLRDRDRREITESESFLKKENIAILSDLRERHTDANARERERLATSWIEHYTWI